MESFSKAFLLLISISYSASQSCPLGWETYMESCYLLVREPYNWFGAKGTCDTLRAKMVDIQDVGENKFIVSMLNQSKYYHDQICRDSNANCPSWAHGGECQKNPGFMLPNCKLSCNTCGPTVPSIWLGAEDFEVEGEFKWMGDATSVEYTNWKRGEPNDSSHLEDCVMMDGNGQWNDVHCESSAVMFGTICEKRPEEDVIG